MVFRKCSTTIILILAVFLLLVCYGFITVQNNQKVINSKDHEIVKRRDHENVLTEQLKVVYRHAQRIEEELKKERERHKKTRVDLLEAKKDFYSNITKTKHEAWTRFNALDSDHKMLRAEHEETKISYSSLQAQYKRLSADHQRIVKQSKEDFITMKESKDRESLSLQDRVQELYKKSSYYQQLSQQNEAYSLEIKEHLENCTKLAQQYKDILDGYTSKGKDSKGDANMNIDDDSSKKLLLRKQDLSNAMKKLLLAKSTTEKVGFDSKAEKAEDSKTKGVREKGDETGVEVKADHSKSKAGVLGGKNEFGAKNGNSKDKENKDSNDKSDIPNPVAFNSRYAEQAKTGEEAVANRRYAGKTKEDVASVPNPLNHLENNEQGNTQSNEVTYSPVGNKELPKTGNDQQQYREERKQLELPKRHDLLETPLPLPKVIEDNPIINGPLDVNNKKDSPIIKPTAKKNSRLDTTKSNVLRTKRNVNEQIHHNERMDVKKVTLEDDENGDQNLDKDAAAGENEKDDEAAGGDEENAKEEHEEVEEKLPNIMEGKNE